MVPKINVLHYNVILRKRQIKKKVGTPQPWRGILRICLGQHNYISWMTVPSYVRKSSFQKIKSAFSNVIIFPYGNVCAASIHLLADG